MPGDPCKRHLQTEKIHIRHHICDIRPRGYKIFFMLNSVEHEILIAHKYKGIKKFGFSLAQISLECYFSLS